MRFNRRRAPSWAENPISRTGNSFEKRVHPRRWSRSGPIFETSSSNRARDAASCIATRSVVRAPIDLHSTAQTVFAVGPVDVDLAAGYDRNPSVCVCDMQFLVSFLDDRLDHLVLGQCFETCFRIDTRGRDNTYIHSSLVMLCHWGTPSAYLSVRSAYNTTQCAMAQVGA